MILGPINTSVAGNNPASCMCMPQRGRPLDVEWEFEGYVWGISVVNHSGGL